VKIIKFLVANGALVNRQYSCEDAALAGAVRAKNKEVVKFLLKHGASIPSHREIPNTRVQEELAAGGARARKRSGPGPNVREHSSAGSTN
jgi:ankyrin repeat protein